MFLLANLASSFNINEDVINKIAPINNGMLFIQAIGIIIPIIGILVLFRKGNNRSAMILMLTNLGCLILNGSYYLMMSSRDIEQGMITLKMENLGNVTFYLSFCLFVYTYLQVNYPKWFFRIWVAVETFSILFLWFGGERFIFSNIEIREAARDMGDFQYLNISLSAPYQLRYSLVAISLILSVVCVVAKIITSNSKNIKRNMYMLLVSEIIVISSLIVTLFAKLQYDIVPISSSFAVLLIIRRVLKGDFLSATELGREWVFEHIEDVFIIVDDNYGFLDANPYAVSIFPELSHHQIGQKIPENIRALFEDNNEDLKIGDRFYEKMISTLTKDDERVGYSLILIDDTRQYTLIEELEVAKDAAESANRAKSSFISNMSHEIRTPMNAIVGMTEILLREELKDEHRGYLQNIKNSGNALLAIINDILDFSKIESGKLSLIEDNYEPMSLLNDLTMIFLNRIGDKPIELLFDIDKDFPVELYGDAIRIRQIIINIMNNAIKFTDEGFVKLTITVERTNDENCILHFSIKDSGQGIKEDDLGRIFESFQQVNTKKNRNKEGTGLGLAITKQLIEMMGGELSVSSVYQQGSDFSFTLPQKIINPSSATILKHSKEELSDMIICEDLQSSYLKESLKKLTKDYSINYITYNEARINNIKADYFITDYSDDLDIRRQILKNPEDDKTFCGLCNPMCQCLKGEHITLINKPLYSLNFCQIINRESANLNLEADDYHINFIAPDAHILIVDDTEMNLKVAVGLLQPLQMNIDTASSGLKAIEMVKSKRYDIIFMDHMMPDMDGIETVEHIRELEDDYYKTVPIIALTANAVVGAKQLFMCAGMDDLVGKPIEMKEICSKIKLHLPREKVIRKIQEDAPKNAAPDNLPVIEGINSKEGVKNSGSESLWLSLLSDYYKLIDAKTNKINECLNNNDIHNFTIEVHALKNTSRMIGALELSEEFFTLEKLGNDNNTEEIMRLIPSVLEHFNSYKDILEPYDTTKDIKQNEVPIDTIIELLKAINESMDAFDLDSADNAFHELEGCILPENIKDLMPSLQTQMADVAIEDVITTTQKMISLLQST